MLRVSRELSSVAASADELPAARTASPDDRLPRRGPRAGLTPAASPSFYPLDGDVGYGLALFGHGFTGTPNVGFGDSDGRAREYRIAWRLTSAVEGDPGFEVNLDATRREPANHNHAAEHAVMLKGLMR